MSVWLHPSVNHPTLSGSEGALLSVSVHVEPRRLEALLDALAQLDFPINPQIFHDAEVIYIYADGGEEKQPATIVEFPAYEVRLMEIRRTLESNGFAPDSLHFTDMLDVIHSDSLREPAPPGAAHVERILRKHAHALASGAAQTF
jgi:hypothetical protein